MICICRESHNEKQKSWSVDRTPVSCTSLTTDRRLRPLSHNNIHNLSMLIVGNEIVDALYVCMYVHLYRAVLITQRSSRMRYGRA